MINIVIPIYTPKLPLPEVNRCVLSVLNNTKIPYKLILSASDKSQPYNINQGLKHKSKYAVILDWDVYVPDNWLEPMIKVLDDNPEVGIIGSKMNGKYNGLNSQVPSGVHEWPTLAGGVMVFRNILKWDEIYPSGYWCDTDFCRQFKEKGYKVYIHGDVVVEHDLYSTRTNNMVSSFMEQGRQIYRRKWGDNEF
jgi:GT2 family glycosyltransferase